MPSIPYKVQVRQHPGSSLEDIWNEPDWSVSATHRIGFNNHIQGDRKPGWTHDGDETLDDEEVRALDDQQDYQSLKNDAKQGKLINFRDVMNQGKDEHLKRPETRSKGQRYVLPASEDWVKNQEEWPANVQKRKKEEEAKKKELEKEREKQHKKQMPRGDHVVDKENYNPNEEHDWKRSQGDNIKHNDAYGLGDEQNEENERKDVTKNHDGKPMSEYSQLRQRYTPQEIALLRSIQHESAHVSRLRQNNGRLVSPMKGHNRSVISIDEADQFSPDNWIPRSSGLIRLTGKHPLNGEPDLNKLWEAGMITPNELHYVRNHGAVPQLRWEFHLLDIEDGKFTLGMDDIKNNFDTVNIPVALACDGNRRKELNMIKRSKGFNWGAGAVSCAYWKGPLLRDVLHAAGVPETLDAKEHSGTRHWVNFEGADSPSEGSYQTCIPYQYAMDPTNDVILAYEMNDAPLPPDHGYPLRLIVPGYVGGRCVKWLKKVWISDKENDSHYHIWDNRVLPAFVTEKDGEFATSLFSHPDTACNEQNLNSVIVKPAQGEEIPLTRAKKGETYRVAGYAYDGGGHEVQRVEISLDDGKTWLYCLRNFPDAPIRHGNKFWTWVHWHIDVEMTHMLQATSIVVRCFNVFKNTQPREPSWNTMGMMNNAWYIVKPEIRIADDSEAAVIRFRHPVQPGTGEGGWMQPSEENRIAQAKQESGTPQKQFTRQEIEKHNSEDDCWLVIDGKVYDVTSVLAWHPGGKAAIVGHAGKVHAETSSEFASIHDDYAYQKLKECVLGSVTEKVANLIKQSAEAAAKEAAKASTASQDLVLQKHRWVPVTLKERKEVTEDTRTYTFSLPDNKKMLGLGTCQHVQIGFHMTDRMVIRSYTPTRPLLPASDQKQPKIASKNGDGGVGSAAAAQRDGQGTFDLTIKTYFPTDAQPGGALSNILDCTPIGETVEIRGPTGDILYNGNGSFEIEGEQRSFSRVSLVLGGSGVTPGYALIARILLSDNDKTQVRVIDANKSEDDILLHGELDAFTKNHPEQLEVTHVLSHPSEKWKGVSGHVSEKIIKDALFEPGENSVVFLCGPPAMIQKAALPALTDWGYEEEKNCFGF